MRPATGITAIELMVTLAVLMVLALVAAPAFGNLLERQRLVGTTNELLSTLHLVRSEAIKRHQRVTLCPSSDGATCREDGDWAQGWIWFADPDATGQRTPQDPLLGHAPLGLNGVAISGNAPVRDYVSYVARGTTQRTSGALQMGSFTVCAGTQGRRVIVSSIGRPRSEPTECTAPEPGDAD